MILLSVVLHSAIALFPVREAPELPEQAVLELPPPITVTRLPALSDVAVPDSADAQPIAPPQAIEPHPAPQIVIPQPVLPVEPTSEPLPVEPPTDMSSDMGSDMSVENAPNGGMSDENGAIGNEGDEPLQSQFSEAEVAAMAAVWEGFLGSVQGGLRESNLLQILSVFGQPWQKDLFFDAQDEAIVSVVTHYLLEDKTPEQVFEDIVNPELMNQEGFEVREYGEFADGPVYEVVQGEIVHYLNIVPLDVDSVMIVSDRPPNAEGDAF